MSLAKAAGAVTAAALLSLPAASPAQGASPVTITGCSVLQYIPPSGGRFWFPWGPAGVASPYTDGVRITYTNNSGKTATRVAFLVNYRGDVEHVIDVGTFSPGATIDHTFGNITGDAFLGSNPNQCRVLAVRFDDGTVWRGAPPPRRRQSSGT